MSVETHWMRAILFPLETHCVRYIKLGETNCWAQDAIERGRLVFGGAGVPHESALAADWDSVRSAYALQHSDPGVATKWTNELRVFHTLGAECLWATTYGAHLYWGFAEAEVHYDADKDPPRWRNMIGGWRCTDRDGRTLNLSGLSSAITKSFRYGTIHKVDAEKRLLARINCESDPAAQAAQEQEAALARTTLTLIRQLDQNDFERLAARLAEAEGWRVETGVGGNQEHVDFIAYLSAVELTGYFQVKTSSKQSQLDSFVAGIAEAPDRSRVIFVTHTAGELTVRGRPHVEVWEGERLGLRAIRAGLLPWILQRLR